MPSATVERKVASIVIGICINSEIPEIVCSRVIGGGARVATRIGAHLVFMVSRDRIHHGVEHAPAGSVTQWVIAQVIAEILKVTQTEHQVDGRVGGQATARPKLSAVLGRSVAAVERGVGGIAGYVTGSGNNGIATLTSITNAPSGQADGHQSRDYHSES